jgi:hypothetical protein
MNAGRHKRLNDRERALRRPCVIGAVGIVHCQHELLTKTRVFVHVDERLMQTVVGKHDRMDVQRRWTRRVYPELQLQPLALWKHVDVAPLNRETLLVAAKR